MDWGIIVDHLVERRSWLDGVVVTGGEPTEDPDLPSLLAALHEAQVQVKLDTNGLRPDVLRHVIAEQLVEYVALDVKAIPSRYGTVCASRGAASLVAQSIEIVIRSRIDHEFRTTAYPGCVGLDELPRIARALRGGRLYVIQQFMPEGTLQPEASVVRPYPEQALRSAAAECSQYLPSVVRDARLAEAV
jgi:pyruvate formate lyase activating enzyme